MTEAIVGHDPPSTRSNTDRLATQHVSGPAAGGAMAEPLEQLARVADAMDAPRIATEAREIAERVAAGRIYIAILGQFKRGKSTLVNALVGERVLPTGIIPVTTVPTVLRYGVHRGARVRTRDGVWHDITIADLPQYVSEEHNPENARGVDAVEVFVPAARLASGMCLVDTPGLGSVFAGNSAATHAFVPHIDAAIVVIGTEPPIAADELALTETVARQVPNLLVVLNKADRVTAGERDAATAFARRVLEQRLGRSIGPIYEVSAAEHLADAGETRDWNAFVASLDQVVHDRGDVLIRGAQERALTRLGAQLLAALETERATLIRPVEESERRIATLAATVTDAEHELDDLTYRFKREQHRVTVELAARRAAFLADRLPPARAELADVLARSHTHWGPALRREALAAAQEIARREVLPWLAEERDFAEVAYRALAVRFVEMANAFLGRLAASGDAELAYLPRALAPERGFRSDSTFYFHELLRIAQPASPLRYALDIVLGAARAGHIRRDGDAFLARLLALNASRVQGDLEQRLSESRRQLEADVRLLLRDVRLVAEQALARARVARAEGAGAVEVALAAVAQRQAQIRALLSTAGADRPADTAVAAPLLEDGRPG